MQTIVAIAFFSVCICSLTSAFDASCNAKFEQFKACHKKIGDGRVAEAKTRDSAIKACYQSSGCTAPPEAKSADANREKNQACMKDVMKTLKETVKTCVQGKVQGLTIPSDAGHGGPGGHEGGWGGHGHNPEKACGTNTAAAATLKTCIQNAHKSAQSGSDQEKSRFDANCKAKADCEAVLGSCKASLDEVEKAMCECGEQIHSGDALTNARKTAPSCQGLPEPQHKGGPGGGRPKKQGSCGEAKKDYCKLGFDAFQADKKARGGKGGHGGPRGGQ